jgi:hypothetical protein
MLQLLFCAAAAALDSGDPSLWSLAAADSMAQVDRRWTPPTASPPLLEVSLARGETEDVQLVVLGGRGGCTQARVEVPALSGPVGDAPSVAVHPVGFVRPGPCPANGQACPLATPHRCRDGSCASGATLKAGKCAGCSRDGPYSPGR